MTSSQEEEYFSEYSKKKLDFTEGTEKKNFMSELR
jgi:hypothetical protein